MRRAPGAGGRARHRSADGLTTQAIIGIAVGATLAVTLLIAALAVVGVRLVQARSNDAATRQPLLPAPAVQDMAKAAA